MTTTIEQPFETHGPPLDAETRDAAAHQPRRRWWIGLLAVLALVAAGFVGYLFAPGDGDPEYVLVGGGTLTDRQEQMVAMADDYVAAWVSNDPSQVTSMMTSSAVMSPTPSVMLYVSDGTLLQFIESNDFSTMVGVDPAVVDGNTVFEFTDLDGVRMMSELDFTTSGDLQISRHAIIYGS